MSTKFIGTYRNITNCNDIKSEKMNKITFFSLRTSNFDIIRSQLVVKQGGKNGKKAREWRDEHPIEAQKGEHIRDYATAEELIILVNMESQNAELIKEGLPQSERFAKLHKMARTQMQILLKNRTKEKLKNVNPNLLKGTTEQ